MSATCSETYYPEWSARGIRGVRCTRPAKFEALRLKAGSPPWQPVCGIHARRYEIRPLPAAGDSR